MNTRRFTMVAVVLTNVACSSGETNPDETTDTASTGGNTTQTPTPTQGVEDSDTTTQTTTPPGNTTTPGTNTGQNPPPSPPVTPPAGTTEEPSPTGGTAGQGDTMTTEVDEQSTTTPATTDTGPTGDTSTGEDTDVVDTGADEKFSFFVTSYYHIAQLAGSEDGFGGDLRYNGAATGLDGADAICQEIARRVGFGHRTWKAYLSTSTVNAIDRIGAGPWYDFLGVKVADSPQDLTTGANRQPGGCCENGTYDELGLFHDGSTDQNNDGVDDDDHDTMTATNEDGTYAGFSCEDWTSTTATSGGGGGGGGGGGPGGGGPGGGGGIMMGHSWPARSGEHWATSHAGHQCAAGTNFVQDGAGDASTVGGGGGYGGFYCFALAE